MKDISLLHITDLHYESPNTNYQDDNKADAPDALRIRAFRNLHSILKHGFRAKTIDAITLGGDITTHGKPHGFDLLEKDTIPVLDDLVRYRQAICMVPGNHDVAWNLDPRQADYFDRKFHTYLTVCQRLGITTSMVPRGPIPNNADDAIEFVTGLKSPVYIDREQQLLILCINSSMRCGEINLKIKDELATPIQASAKAINLLTSALPTTDSNRNDLVNIEANLQKVISGVDRRALFDIPHVTHVQLSEISALLSEMKIDLKGAWPSYVKIALLHHHLVPFNYQMPEYKPFEIMADAAPVLEALASFGFQMVLTGHKHQPYEQQVRFHDSELLVIGGMTVGGYPIPGFTQGLRHLGIQRINGDIVVRVANLPCNQVGDVQTGVKEALATSREYRLQRVPVRRHLFPEKIEKAVEAQLYGRSFYKTDVAFHVEVTETDNGRLCFNTEFSYSVINRSDEAKEWRLEYKYDENTGKVEEVRIDGKDFHAEQRDFHNDRGLTVPYKIRAGEGANIYLRIRELWEDDGSTLYTSYNPATDLRVIVRSNAPNIDFDFEPLYFLDEWDRVQQRPGYYEIFFDQGILPYEGLRLNWKRRGKSQ